MNARNGIAAAAAGFGLLAWLGPKIRPRPFPPFPQRTPVLETIPLPDSLPAPVERFYRQVYGERVPVITSAVLTGKAMMRPAGPFMFPARFRMTYIAGQAYRHYIELALFGQPAIIANEHYIDGKGHMEITIIGEDEGEKNDQAANLGLWAETSFFPAVYLTDRRVRWEPVDGETALLVVPFKDQEQRFVVRFDPRTGLIDILESMRYRSSQSDDKVLWLNQIVPGAAAGDVRGVPPTGAVTWMDQGKPWFVMTVEDAVLQCRRGAVHPGKRPVTLFARGSIQQLARLHPERARQRQPDHHRPLARCGRRRPEHRLQTGHIRGQQHKGHGRRSPEHHQAIAEEPELGQRLPLRAHVERQRYVPQHPGEEGNALRPRQVLGSIPGDQVGHHHGCEQTRSRSEEAGDHRAVHELSLRIARPLLQQVSFGPLGHEGWPPRPGP